jgi:hypothetical protein
LRELDVGTRGGRRGAAIGTAIGTVCCIVSGNTFIVITRGAMDCMSILLMDINYCQFFPNLKSNRSEMEANALFMVAVVLIITALWFYEKKNYNQVPKRIWTYWDRPLTKTVKRCRESWAKWNPEYEIVVLTKTNYFSYVTIPQEITMNPIFEMRFSEWIRLWILVERGGVWMDAGILLQAPLENWMFPKYAEFSGFYMDQLTTNPLHPVIEPCFMACNKGCMLLSEWKNEYLQMARYASVDKYVESRMDGGIRIHRPMDHVIQIALLVVLQKENYLDSLILQKAEEGPFRYLVEAKWNSEKAVQNLSSDSPIVMLREEERHAMEKEIKTTL